jgi:hypothetical protein
MRMGRLKKSFGLWFKPSTLRPLRVARKELPASPEAFLDGSTVNMEYY